LGPKLNLACSAVDEKIEMIVIGSVLGSEDKLELASLSLDKESKARILSAASEKRIIDHLIMTLEQLSAEPSPEEHPKRRDFYFALKFLKQSLSLLLLSLVLLI